MFRIACRNGSSLLESSTQSGGYLTTTVYVDGSYWKDSRQAGAGVYFQTPEHLVNIGFHDNRTSAFPCPIYRSSIGAELFASYMALYLYIEHPYPHEQIDRSVRFLDKDYSEPLRRLVIKQDCQKAIRMILYCLERQRKYQNGQKRISKDLRLLNTEKYKLGLSYKTHNNNSGPLDQPYTCKVQMLDKSIHSILTANCRSSNSTTPQSESLIIGAVPTKLCYIFEKEWNNKENVIIDDTHDKFQITMQDIYDHLPLLEQITSLFNLCSEMFEVYWLYVKAHQVANSNSNSNSTCDNNNNSNDNIDDVVDDNGAKERDRFGNDMADALAKEGSSHCTPNY